MKAAQPVGKKMNTYLQGTKPENSKQATASTVKTREYYKSNHQTIESKDVGYGNFQK